jgi:hypothetical protein
MLDWKHTYDASFGPNSSLKPPLPLLNKFTQRPQKKKKKGCHSLPHFNGGKRRVEY